MEEIEQQAGDDREPEQNQVPVVTAAESPKEQALEEKLSSLELGDPVNKEQNAKADGTKDAEVTDPVISTPVANTVTTSKTTTQQPLQSSEQQQQSLSQIAPELLVKHPLQYRWVLWYCKSERGKNWEDCLKEVATFDTVEDFWALYNHIQLASGLSWMSDYYLFKEGIKPMWEDETNVDGGRWLVLVEKLRRNELLDHYWLELLMAMIGEQFEQHGDQICGAVVNIRNKGDKVSLWTRDSSKEDVNRRIGEILKQKLDVMDTIRYEAHKENSNKQSSMAKPMWSI